VRVREGRGERLEADFKGESEATERGKRGTGESESEGREKGG
jgi:hypothetical protein